MAMERLLNLFRQYYYTVSTDGALAMFNLLIYFDVLYQCLIIFLWSNINWRTPFVTI